MGERSGKTAHEALAKAYEVDANDVEAKILKFRDGTIKALICIEGWCELYDVKYEETRWGRGWLTWLSSALKSLTHS